MELVPDPFQEANLSHVFTKVDISEGVATTTETLEPYTHIRSLFKLILLGRDMVVRVVLGYMIV